MPRQIAPHRNAQSLGILMLDTRFPRVPGDVGNAYTWPFAVRYHIVTGVETKRAIGQSPDAALLEPFISAAKEVESFGVGAITTDCGFLAPFQKQICSAVNIPVVTSALAVVPLVYRMTGSSRPVGILTDRVSSLTEAHFNGVGWSSRDVSLAVYGLPEGAYFQEVFTGNKSEADLDLLEADVRRLALSAIKEAPDMGALVFECASFVPWARMVHEMTGLPVFHVVNATEMAVSGSFRKSYRQTWWRGPQP